MLPVGLATVVLFACDSETVREQGLHDGPVDPGERTWLEMDWDTLWSVGGADDLTLHDPVMLRPHDGGLALWDRGRSQVLSFDRTGELEWSFGAEGRGPDEFHEVLDLQVSSDGRPFVYDFGNQRVTVLDRRGSVERRVDLPDVPRATSMAVPGDTLLAFVALSGAEDPLRVLDLDGNTVLAGDLPWEGFNHLSAISRQGRAHARGGRWAYAFGLANGWFGFQGTDPMDYQGGFVEHQELPGVVEQTRGRDRTVRLVGRPRCTACALSVTDSLLAVHFGGHGERPRGTLDLYRWENAAYVGSWELPGSVREAMVVGERVYTLEVDPFPVVTALRRGPEG